MILEENALFFLKQFLKNFGFSIFYRKKDQKVFFCVFLDYNSKIIKIQSKSSTFEAKIYRTIIEHPKLTF